MKYSNFCAKLLCLVLVLGMLWYYQGVAQARAAIMAENEAAIEEVEAYNAEILRQQNALAEIYNAGTYEGTGNGFGGQIKVSVTVCAADIESIEVLEHPSEDEAYFTLAEEVVYKVLKKQSADVDTVSGATFSSGGLLEAIGDALGKAVK